MPEALFYQLFLMFLKDFLVLYRHDLFFVIRSASFAYSVRHHQLAALAALY